MEELSVLAVGLEGATILPRVAIEDSLPLLCLKGTVQRDGSGRN